MSIADLLEAARYLEATENVPSLKNGIDSRYSALTSSWSSSNSNHSTLSPPSRLTPSPPAVEILPLSRSKSVSSRRAMKKSRSFKPSRITSIELDRSPPPPSRGGRLTTVTIDDGSKVVVNHNELEKLRRAHLRNCLNSLKQIIPKDPDVNRFTTLGLLMKTKKFIRSLEESERRRIVLKKQLEMEQFTLKSRLQNLISDSDERISQMAAQIARDLANGSLRCRSSSESGDDNDASEGSVSSEDTGPVTDLEALME
ncbi:unnamed protein product [Cyprideis torosa]|uniref:Uncharacterized protein n=1 Tax=Cyprideis torosa TaxID=163714 RepID=A0A7R8WAV0_9CRUS|nr:unnamed protein product [Cyprideis torosa]CAG0891499.1 unnamed protein product [Cyprideis torosa]